MVNDAHVSSQLLATGGQAAVVSSFHSSMTW